MRLSVISQIILIYFTYSVRLGTCQYNDIEHYEPKWESLDKRSLPEWYDNAKIGIFIHWGVYSVPGFGTEWFWINWKEGSKGYVDFMNENYKPGFSYQEFAPMFTAEFFNATEWANLFVKSGAKYVVLTSKHHDGYALFPSRRSFGWNSVEVGPKRDIVGELGEAVRNRSIKFGVYHSLFEWFNPIYNEDKLGWFSSQNFPKTKLWPDIKQLVEDYRPSILWADGDWEAFDTYWNSTGLLAWLYNESSVKDEIVVNDRWGIGCGCKHGDFYNCQDRFNPGTLQSHKWENAFTIDSKSWGFRKTMDIRDVLTTGQIIKEVVTTVSCGGNTLINVGPTKEGKIAPIFQERLLQLGAWLNTNGEAIYNTKPWTHQNDTTNGNVWYTCLKTTHISQNPIKIPNDVEFVYAIFLKWPINNILNVTDLKDISEDFAITILGNEESDLKWEKNSDFLAIELPNKATLKSQYAWALKIRFAKNL